MSSHWTSDLRHRKAGAPGRAVEPALPESESALFEPALLHLTLAEPVSV